MRLPISLLGLALLISSCSKSPTAPTIDPRTPAPPAVAESFKGVVPVGGAKFFSFSVTQYGTVDLTLNRVDEDGSPSAAMLGIGIGRPSGTRCATSSVMNTAAGTTPQLTGPYEIGVYCANVADIGELSGPASFDVTIAHP